MVLQRESDAMTEFDSDEEPTEVDCPPFEISWLDLSITVGQVGISGLPGCRFKDQWRNLEKDIGSIHAANTREIFVLCTRGELTKYRVPWLLHELSGIDDFTVRHYPFPDGSVPNMSNLMKMLQELKLAVMAGRKPLIHCFGGLGRSCLVAACFLMYLDVILESDSAIQRLRQLRGPGAIQSVKQYNFLHEFRDNLAEYENKQVTVARSVSR